MTYHSAIAPVRTRPLSGTSAAEVKADLKTGIDALRRLRAHGCFPSQKASTWPSIVQDFWDAYGAADSGITILRPTSEQIDVMDRVIPWLFLIDDIDRRKLVFASMAGIPKRRLAYEFSCSRETIRRYVNDACDEIASKLNGGKGNEFRRNRSGSRTANERTWR